MNPRKRSSIGIVAASFVALLAASPARAQNDSQPRVVRLSFVEGDVTLQRPDVQTWAQAPVNTPLTQGFRLATGENSFAEIQFENGGTIRVGQFALIVLSKLQLAADGGTIEQLDLRKGYATFHSLPSNVGESLQVNTPSGTLTSQGSAEFRVDLDQGVERVEVFDGSVDEQSNLGAVTIPAESVIVIEPGASEPITLTQGITTDDWDQWVQSRDEQTSETQEGPSPESYSDAGADSVYGWADLQQYGGWSVVPGEGLGWSPNDVDSDWAPYSLGRWCWYPGWGYTWIGAEPWGWLPFHFGSWEFLPGRGWVWFPLSLNRWRPNQVTWFQGSNWIGWVPRRKDGASPCGAHCGGGTTSLTAFRQGGIVNPGTMLRVSPGTGARVREPGIAPTMAAKLPGPAAPSELGQGQTSRGTLARRPGGGGVATASQTSGARRAGARATDSTIVYDALHNRYVNNPRVTRSAPRPAQANSTRQQVSPGAGEQTENQGIVQSGPKAAPGSTSPVATIPRTGFAPKSSPNAAVDSSHGENMNSGQRGSRASGSALGGRWASAPSGGSRSSGGYSSGAAPSGGHSGAASGGGGGHAGGGGGGGGGHH